MTHLKGALSFISMSALVTACAAPMETEEQLGTQSSALASCAEQPLVATATASSEQNAGFFAAAKAVDSRSDTRWSSQPGLAAPQWLRLDFGQRKFVSSLSINWETAFAPSYEIQASDNGVNWAVLRKVTNTQPGVQTIGGLDATARYIRILAKTLSGYGNVSIIDLTASGDSNPACNAAAATCGQSTRLAPVAAQATTQQFSYTPASGAVDGIYSTRWSSAASDDQALALDLGSVARIDALRLTWEAAYATRYGIEIGSSMNGPWTEVARINNGGGGVETVPVNTSARYLRLHGIQRATGYGYSLWELDVLGSRDVSCAPNLLTRGWDPAATSNNFGAPSDLSVPGVYSIDPSVLNRIDLSQSGQQYCPVGSSGWLAFTQRVTVPTAGSRFHLVLDIPRNEGSAGFVVAAATLGGVAGTSWQPVPTNDSLGNPGGSLTGTGKLEADFVTNLAAGQSVDLQVRFTIIGAGIPNTGCGVMLQSYTLGGATLTRTN
jgi:hypothetical protein